MKHKLTDLDVNQIVRYSYDEEHQAQRVVISGVSGLAEAVKAGLATANISVKSEMPNIKLPEVERIVFQERIKTVEVPTIVVETKIQEVEKQVIVKEIEVREVQVPVVTTEIREIPVPVITKEIQVVTVEKQSDLYIKIFVIANGLATLGLLALNLIKR